MKNQKNKIQIGGGDPPTEGDGTAAKNSDYENGKPRSSSSSSNSKGNTSSTINKFLRKGCFPRTKCPNDNNYNKKTLLQK